LLQQCDAVVHLAGIADSASSEEAYNQINHRATKALARAAVRCGAHLVFISSIAAQCGRFSSRDVTESDAPAPENAYGRSKLAAERAVRESGAIFTILRPVLIYGEGEKGRLALVRSISRLPIPLPFGALTALRSFLSVDNFNSGVRMCLTHFGARGETFILSEPTPLTMSEVFARYRANLGMSPMLVPVPEEWIKFSLKAIGQTATWERIGCRLVAPPRKLLALGWQPS
jgi:UDP-glucose 4-epimerase